MHVFSCYIGKKTDIMNEDSIYCYYKKSSNKFHYTTNVSAVILYFILNESLHTHPCFHLPSQMKLTISLLQNKKTLIKLPARTILCDLYCEKKSHDNFIDKDTIECLTMLFF